jgi:hypothetical protein
MRRPPHGATTGPGPCRPLAGYGRPIGRPGPLGAATACAATAAVAVHEPACDERDGAGQSVISASASAIPGDPGPVPAI